jgi:hypothetical protein
MISLCSAVSSVASSLYTFKNLYKVSFVATAHLGPAEAVQAPARDNPAGRPASAQGNRAGVGQLAQVAGPGNPAPGE